MTNLPYTIHNGNSIEVLKTLEENSIDSIVCDPPYELGFMNKKWDSTGIAYNVELWKECFRVLKPGGHILAFSGSRTYHRMAVAIEDAGFDIRDQIMWVFATGFPKSHDVSKAIDKMAGAEREVIESMFRGNNAGKKNGIMGQTLPRIDKITVLATEEAEKWQGWGTALKPAHEPICLARKPLIGTVAENVLKYETGAINIDGCRVGTDELTYTSTFKRMIDNNIESGYRPETMRGSGGEVTKTVEGRFPANLIHDGSEEVVSLFPENAGGGHWGDTKVTGYGKFGNGKSEYKGQGRKDGLGSASRFFYCAKASKKDRDEGLDGFEEKQTGSMNGTVQKSLLTGSGNIRDTQRRNIHPTVKPTTLMQYLCRLITPPNGVVLDPFMGSGSTGKAAMYEGFRFIGIDLEPEYCQIAKSRIEFALRSKDIPEKPDTSKNKKSDKKIDDVKNTSLW